MSTLTFNYTQFIAFFPAFSNSAQYPEPMLQQYWDMSVFYVSDYALCNPLQSQQRQYAIYLMMCHLLFINSQVTDGQTPAVTESATIDKVSIKNAPPPVKNQWQWWLSTSPYGQQLLALLQSASVGGFYVGGSPVLGSFRWGMVGRGGFCC